MIIAHLKSDFVNHSYDDRPNWTPLSLITIMNNFVSGVGALDTLRSLLKCKDHWKINLRRQHEETYTALRRSLLMEALFAAETCL